jgi:putative inorganic carbon (hco3(-)) transporter
MNNVFLSILSIEFVIVLTLLILLKPYLGVVFTLVSLPVIDLLPAIPYLTSSVVLVGALTLAGFLFQRKREGRPLFNLSNIQSLVLLFIAWIFISNPRAAWFGIDRNWVLTFFQLWILVWLTSELLDSPGKQHVFMWCFAIACAVSAVLVIQQGQIGSTIADSIRAGGLADQPNLSARYFIVSLIFFAYLNRTATSRLPRFLAIGGVIVTFIGVFFTLSRSGILLLMVAVGLQIIWGQRQKRSYGLIVIFILASILMWLVSDKIIDIIRSILPSIQYGTDTAGIRYKLWQAGWAMWLAHPIQGVGIGMFSQQLRFYASNLPPHYWSLGPHNTYVSVLSETGIVGFGIFLTILAVSIKNYLLPDKNNDNKTASLRFAWLTAFLIVLFGGITMHGNTDKLLWFLIGMSIYFQKKPSAVTLEKSVPLNGIKSPAQ